MTFIEIYFNIFFFGVLVIFIIFTIKLGIGIFRAKKREVKHENQKNARKDSQVIKASRKA